MSEPQQAVSNSGPIMHLNEIGAMKTLRIFRQVYIPPEVGRETTHIKKPSAIQISELSAKAKDLAKLLIIKNAVDLGEAQAIALAASRGMRIFLTDDLAARDAAKQQNLEPHGTLGILLRAFREGIITKSAAISYVELLRTRSTLFLTKDLVEWINAEIEKSGK
ncbi:hypothetical protein HYU17_03305 [Candidatus Woesearchaeota archaeon]|nr:hypothetical protein [Candidatus Woesearchaeota archaeon]